MYRQKYTFRELHFVKNKTGINPVQNVLKFDDSLTSYTFEFDTNVELKVWTSESGVILNGNANNGATIPGTPGAKFIMTAYPGNNQFTIDIPDDNYGPYAINITTDFTEDQNNPGQYLYTNFYQFSATSQEGGISYTTDMGGKIYTGVDYISANNPFIPITAITIYNNNPNIYGIDEIWDGRDRNDIETAKLLHQLAQSNVEIDFPERIITTDGTFKFGSEVYTDNIKSIFGYIQNF